MDNGGWFAFGELPDDTDGPGDEDASHRGWIDPDDRLWRHPSEMSRQAVESGRPAARDIWHERRGPIAAGTLGAAAVVVAAGVVLALANTPSLRTVSTPLRATVTSLVTGVPSVMEEAVATLRPSLVELRATGSKRHTQMTGVVLPGGRLVVTSAAAIAGVSKLEIVTSGGKELTGTVVASDQSSGVAVVKASHRLIPAVFADVEVMPGQMTVTACLSSPRSGSRTAAPVTDMAVGFVQDVGSFSTSSGATRLMDAIEAVAPIKGASGGVLIDERGEVIAILDAQESSSSGTIGLFVPAPLALGVAQELAAIHRVEHGWIGVSATDAANGAGADIVSVFGESPAAKVGIEAGDVVTEIDGHVVRTHADLQGRLYTLAPGQDVSITLNRNGTSRTFSVPLAAETGS